MTTCTEFFPSQASKGWEEQGLHTSISRAMPFCGFRFDVPTRLQVCEAAGQAWVEDPSNATPVYLRNRVRAVLQDPQAGQMPLPWPAPASQTQIRNAGHPF